MAATLKPPSLNKAETCGEHQVWIVDGGYIRGHLDAVVEET